MYLLILLMTYVSAIYEYNLSVRPEYDRDVALKKASAIFYKFDVQHSKALASVRFISGRKNADDEFVDPTVPQPNTIFAASKVKCEDNVMCKSRNAHDSTLFFDDTQGNDIPIFLKPECEDCHICEGLLEDVDPDECQGASSIEVGDNGSYYQRLMLSLDQKLYDETEMASRLMCLTGKLYDDDAETCISETDGEGNLTGTCCGSSDGTRVLVSYKSVDPRWLNRLTNGISIDFWRAMEDRPYYTNLGIIQWDDAKDRWIFRGKTSLYAAYYNVLQEWNEKEEEKLNNDSSYVIENFPKYMTRITEWELPEIFTEDFFVSSNGTELCKNTGCIFRINEM